MKKQYPRLVFKKQKRLTCVFLIAIFSLAHYGLSAKNRPGFPRINAGADANGKMQSNNWQGIKNRRLPDSASLMKRIAANEDKSLLFIENKGQVNDQYHQPRADVLYSIAAGNGLNIFIGKGAIHYQFSKQSSRHTSKPMDKIAGLGAGIPDLPQPENLDMYRMDVELVGANKNAAIVADEQQVYHENYFNAHTGPAGAIAHSYTKITCKDIYPHIDWVLYSSAGKLKHEFIVKKGGKVSDIQLKYGGASALKINQDGSLAANTPQGTIKEQTPYSYQQDGKTVKSNFKLDGDILTYTVDNYNGQLTIDPNLAWATYYGGSGEDRGYGITLDDSGYIYVAGESSSIASIATTGSYQSSFAGGGDAFLVKFDSSGQRIWATYFGGSSEDRGNSIAIDNAGNIYLSGYTISTSGIATPGAFQDTYGGIIDAFLSKFDRDGVLKWSTYYGGDTYDISLAVGVDGLGYVYIAGQTGSTSGIASDGAYQTTFNGLTDAFLAKFDSLGVRQWATYYGGNNDDEAEGLAIDMEGNVFITGSAGSSSGIATTGAYQTTYGGNWADAFLAKFNSMGALQWSTYYGGTSPDVGTSIAIDGPGNVYIVGYTGSDNGITTAGAYQAAYGGGEYDAFMAKFNNDGTLQWGTYFGSAEEDAGRTICTDSSGNIYFAGNTLGISGMATTGAYQVTSGGSTDVFFSEFNSDGMLQWSTYFGADGVDAMPQVAASSSGSVYLTGLTLSTGGLVSSGAWQDTYGGGPYDAFLAKFSPGETLVITSGMQLCTATTVTMHASISGGTWSSSNTLVATAGPATGIVTGITAGTATITYTLPSSLFATVVVTVATSPAAITGTLSLCPANIVTFTDATTGGVWSSSHLYAATVGSSTGVVTAVGAGSTNISYTVGSCSAVAEVTVSPTPSAGSISGPLSVAIGATTSYSNAMTGGTWSIGGTHASITSGGVVTGISAGTAIVSYSVINTCGTAVDTNVITVFATDDTLCPVWMKCGPSPIPGSFIFFNKLGMDSTGRPYIANVQGDNMVSVKKYDGAGWENMGASFDPGMALTFDFAVAKDGRSYLASTPKVDPYDMVDMYNGHVMVKAYNGVGFSMLGDFASPAHIDNASITVDNAGTPYVCYAYDVYNGHHNPDGNDVEVKRFNSGTYSWEPVGAGFGHCFFNTRIAVAGDGTPYVVYTDLDFSGKATVKKFNGTSWVTVGSPGISDAVSGAPAGFAKELSIAIGTDNTPYIAFADDNLKATVMKYNGASWVTVGNAAFTPSATGYIGVYALELSMSLGKDNTPYVTYGDFLHGHKLNVDKFDGSAWVHVAGSDISTGSVKYTSIAIDENKIPYVIFGDQSSNTATVMSIHHGVPEITGAIPVCIGSPDTLHNAAAGGTWSSGSTAIATVGSASGIVTGVIAGTAVISYTVGSCSATTIVTITSTVGSLDTITGTPTLCVSSTTTLADATPGGIWSSGNTAVATVGSGTGIVSGIATGTARITYTLSGSCGTATTIKIVTVNAAPSAGTITGTAILCAGATTTLSDATTGGSWSSSATSIATVSTAGVVSGVASGTATISYTVTNSCGTATVTKVVTVNSTPSAGTITGAASVNIGSTNTLTASVTGGSWSVSNAHATVSTSGVVTGVSTGSVTVSYTVSNSCGTAVATKVINVLYVLSTGISGNLSVCAGSTTALSNATPGGTWSTSASVAVMTIVPSTGLVTAISAGTGVVTYTYAGSPVTAIVTVNPLPATIAGASSVCLGSTTTLTDATTGGTWSSNNAAIASVSSAGVVTGNAVASTIISYTSAAGCYRTYAMTVRALPAPITGPASVCGGSSATFTDITTGGTGWTSSNPAVGSIGAASGVFTGISSGTTVLTYSILTGCTATKTVTVSGLSAITGTPSVCVGSTTALANSTSGGTWASSAPAFGTVNASTGVVTGIAAGVTNIVYTLGSCSRAVQVTVNALPAAISGTTGLCTGTTTALGSTPLGGTWTSSSPGVASVSGLGVASGISAGTATISYTLSTGCMRSVVVTVSSAPSITGTTTICMGSSTTLGASVAGGTWTSSNTTVASAGVSSGLITGLSIGTTNITYAISAFCKANITVTVGSSPAAITGTASMCVGATTTLSDVTTGGVWSSSNTAIASVVAGTGIVTGVGAGTATITYATGTGCYQVKTVTVGSGLGSITGNTGLCIGASTTYISTSPSVGVGWSSSNTAIATVGALSGVVTGVGTGTATITFTPYGFSTYAGCVATRVVSVNAVPSIAPITGPSSVTIGHTITLADAIPGGTWSSSNPALASVSGGVVTGIAGPAVIISYSIANGACVYPVIKLITITASKEITFAASGSPVSLYPNPTDGKFTLQTDVAGTLIIYSLEGKEVQRSEVSAGTNAMSLRDGLPAGIYMCRFDGVDGTVVMVRLVYETH